MLAVNDKYLENSIGLPLVHLEALGLQVLDGYGASQVFTVAHVCEPTAVLDAPNTYRLLVKNI